MVVMGRLPHYSPEKGDHGVGGAWVLIHHGAVMSLFSSDPEVIAAALVPGRSLNGAGDTT